MAKFFLESFGCKFNQAESELIRRVLKEKKHKEVLNEKEADFIILHTCGVVEKTERKIIKRAQSLKKVNKKIIFTGCLPIISPEITRKISVGMIGPTNILDLPKIVNKVLKGKKAFSLKQTMIDKAKLGCFFIPENTVVAIIPISEGCLSNCAYCASKFARGRLKSFDKDAILENIKTALNRGAKEIQLTSQDLGIYGVEKGKWQLPNLLREILKIDGNFKVRLGMMNPLGAKKIFKELLKIMEDKKIYKFLHLPLQSGDDEVLKSMNRNYKVGDFLTLVQNFKKKFRNSMLATDIIVGFPTENEKAFQNTIKIIKRIKPEILHLFKFSKREGTEAAKLKDLPDRIKKERSRILNKTWLEILEKENKKFLGKKFKALITEKRGEKFLGRLQSYKAVILSKGELGVEVKVKIVDFKPNYLIGEVI